MDLPPSSYHDSLEDFWDKEEEPEEIETVMKVVPSDYHQYLDVFSKLKAEKLPPHHACDHHIELEGSLPPVEVIYSLSNQESDTLRAYISENVEKVFIRQSSSSTSEPMLFVEKKDVGLPLCVEYHKLNSVTWKNKYPVSPMNQLLNVFNVSYILSNIDLRGAYNLLRIKEGDEHLTDFRTKYGSYEYLVMPFGLTNASASFQNLVNDILQYLLDVYVEIGENFISKNQMSFQQLIKQDEVQPPRYFAVKVESFSNLIDSIQKSLCILQKRYDSPLAGHPGQQKTLKLVKRDFHWSGMTQFVKDYVSSCQQCSRNKNIHHKKFGLLKPLPIPNGCLICLSMELITQLPLSNSFYLILVIVDRFSKMEIFIPTMSSITSLDLDHLFIKKIYSKHGLPYSIVSDRGSLFVSSFWINLCHQLKILRDLSTAYHPETDRQTERVNQILDQYPWMYVSYHQDDWNTWLPLAELTYNNSDHLSTKQSPFLTVYGRDPQFNSAHITQDTPSGKLSTKIQSVQQYVKRKLEVAISTFRRYADKIRASPPVFTPGDMVWLSSKNIKSTIPTKNSLKDVKTSTIPNWHQTPPPPIIIEEEEEWEVSQILDSKLKRGKLWYLVEWKGFSQDPEISTWEPIESLKIFPELVKDFHSLYPDKPGLNSSTA
ncbi:hypothetical protein O181_068985 [Austropuccinia psidii MF-1]|uniref:Integrase catalytic domain-containing protein n=1 Tax=Austropuccinia psidii MF-1 TaxID=1389203 RepID=A0A9Q3I7L4_9BASI|nr:hypothetical protein [Austropuccinia psidii MF-1]